MLERKGVVVHTAHSHGKCRKRRRECRHHCRI